MGAPTVRRSLAPPLRDAPLLQPEQLQEKIAALERQLADAKSAGARADEKLRLSAASAEKRDLAAAMRAAEDAKRIETLEREVAATAQKADSLSRSLRKAREEAAGGRSDGGIAAAADLEAQLESVSAALEAERLEAKRAKRAAAEEIAELQRMLEVRREEHASASERDRCPVHGQTCHLPPPTSPVPAEPALFSWRAPLAASQWRWRGRVRRNASGCAAPMRTSWYSCSSSWPRHRPVRTRASRRFRSGSAVVVRFRHPSHALVPHRFYGAGGTAQAASAVGQCRDADQRLALRTRTRTRARTATCAATAPAASR